MQNSQLSLLLQSFGALELRNVRKFLSSPFFNTRQDLLDLFDCMVANKGADKMQVWQHLQPNEAFDDQKLRLLMSYLHKLLEHYLVVNEMTSDQLTNRLKLAVAYRKRGMVQAFQRSQQLLEKALVDQPLRNANFFQNNYQLHWEKYHIATSESPTAALPLQDLAGSLDVYYLSLRLRLICFALAQQTVYHAGQAAYLEADIVALAEHEKWMGEAAVMVYLHCYRMLKMPGNEAHFKAFKAILLEAGQFFDREEMLGLYLLAINYCIRRLNDGQRLYLQEVLDLYKSGLTTGYLLQDGMLSRFTYHNIVAAGIQSGDLDWVNYFIHEYKTALERSYRESSFSFNLARLEYARNRYDAVLELLQKANYRDPLLNLAAKTLLLKTWYDLDELDLLQSHLDAMRNYIHRKRVLGYHRTNYLNIVRYTDKLLKINWMNKVEVDALRQEIRAEEILTERDWLLEQLE